MPNCSCKCAATTTVRTTLGRNPCSHLCRKHARLMLLTLMCRTADALPLLRDVNSSASNPA